MTRSRQRGRRPQTNHSHQHNPNRTFDSNGPEVKIRGSAAHVYEKYLQLARDANASGDRIAAENYLQHAEHYYRILAANQVQQQQQFQARGQQPYYNGNGRVPVSNEEGQSPIPGEPSFSLGGDSTEGEPEPAPAE